MTDLEALKARLRDDGHMTQRDGLAAMLATAHKAADAIERLEAETIALTTYRENLRDECRELLAKIECLEASNAKLREALDWALSEIRCATRYDDERQFWNAYDTARAALKG